MCAIKNSRKRFSWRRSLRAKQQTRALAGSLFAGLTYSPRGLVAMLCAVLVFLDFSGVLWGGPAAVFGAIEEVKPAMQVTSDNYGIRLRFPTDLFYDSATSETYLVTGGKGQLTVFADDLFPLATAGPGRGIYTPQGGAIDRNGQVYIAQGARDGRPSRITVLNGAWIITREISFDQIPEATNFVPRGLAVSSDGLIYVASQHRGVMVLDNEGNFQRWLQPKDKVKKRPSAAATEKPAEKENPPDLAADQPKEDLAEAETAEESGSESGGPPDSEDASGQRPVRIRAVTIDSVGNIYLVSSETGKIYVYGPDEAFLFSFGTKGGTPGRLSQPRGVAIDRERGLMYVVDYMRHTILTYDKDGTYLFEFGGKGEAPGWFKFPTDVALNKYGQVIIADYFNHRLQVLDVRYQKEFPSLEELKKVLPPAKATGGARPAGLERDSPEAGATTVEGTVPESPAVQPDAEVKEEVIPKGQGGTVIIEEVLDQRSPVLLPATPSPIPAPVLPPAAVTPPAQRVEAGVPASPEVIKPATILLEERRNPVVSAIVWHEDSSARMAVVDGLPVMTGEFVGTAKVQEIQRDRILFVEEGKFFTVFVDPQ